METVTLWRGYRSFTGDNDYETVTYENASEIGMVRFTVDGDDIQYRIYRIFRNEKDGIIVYFMERKGYDVYAEIYEYASLDEAKKHYAFILRKAGVI